MPLDKLLGRMQNSSAITSALSGAAGGALVSAFTNKKSAKNLLKAGGLVAVGGLAYKAYQSYRNSQSQAATQTPIPQITETQFNDVVSSEQHPETTALVLQSMIAAAHADNHLTAEEQQQVWQHALKLNLPSGDLAELNNQLTRPVTIAQLSQAADSFETKIELYTGALIVIDDSCQAGQQYLQQLATALALPEQLVNALHAQTAASQTAA